MTDAPKIPGLVSQLSDVSVGEQYEWSGRDGLRVLVVGAGIAGLTFAQLLRRAGHEPIVVERGLPGAHPGYMLALMPMVDPALAALGVTEEYLESSTALDRFVFRSHVGRAIRDDSVRAFLSSYGNYRGISRAALIDTLARGRCPVAFGTTVRSLENDETAVKATFSTTDDSGPFDFDLVVAADGIDSTTRPMLLGHRNVGAVDTGWGGWVVWVDDVSQPQLVEELWGAGFFLGAYPVQGKVGAFVGGPHENTSAGPRSFTNTIRGRLDVATPRLSKVLDTVSREHDPYYWRLEDRRSPQWAAGRGVLVGDAAAAFLPTAGVGAGMAIESAWVLARMVTAARREDVPGLLRHFEEIQRPRVESAQDASRRLARLMFSQSVALAVVRDLTMRFVSMELALKPITKLLENRPTLASVDRSGSPRPVADDERSSVDNKSKGDI